MDDCQCPCHVEDSWCAMCECEDEDAEGELWHVKT